MAQTSGARAEAQRVDVWMLGYCEGSIAGEGSYVTPEYHTPSFRQGRALCRRTVKTSHAKSPRHHGGGSRLIKMNWIRK
jgi:hypothetical protein